MHGLVGIGLRAATLAMLVIGVAGVIGVAYQDAGEQADLQRFPPPGRMFDIGGRSLDLVCDGPRSGPTVVFEASSGNDSTFWQGMVKRMSASMHACTYDRAGLGWSDAAPGRQTIDDRAEDLHTLLDRAAVPKPYILAGHSYGGYIVRRFATLHPDLVAGIVLIDAPDEVYSFAPEGMADISRIRSLERQRAWFVRLGLARLARRLFPATYDPVRGVPRAVHAEFTALYLRDARHFATADEMASYSAVPEAQREAHGLGTLADTPLAIVSAPTPGNPDWQDAQHRLRTLSTDSTQLLASEPGHMIQFTDPEAIVRAIHWVLDRARSTSG